MSEPRAPRLLWRTVCGSHAWGMEHAGSDVDLFTCYLTPTIHLLDGSCGGGGAHFTHGADTDEQRHELSRWVDEMLKNNPNYITGVFSPLVRDDPFGLLGTFRLLSLRARSKAIYRPTRGIATSNLKDAVAGNFTPEVRAKKLRLVERQVLFGVRWLLGEDIEFRPVRGDLTPEDVRRSLAMLDVAHEHSALPDKPENEDEFREFQRVVRLWDLAEHHDLTEVSGALADMTLQRLRHRAEQRKDLRGGEHP